MPVTPVDLARNTPTRRLRLAVEILVAYGRVRWTMWAHEPPEAVAKLRAHAHRHRFDGTKGSDVIAGWRLGRRLDGAQSSDVVAGWRLGQAVIKTLRPLPTDSRCLMRSLTLLTIMERRSLSPTLVIAVRPQPFAAHAWIELRGYALLPAGDPAYERITEL